MIDHAETKMQQNYPWDFLIKDVRTLPLKTVIWQVRGYLQICDADGHLGCDQLLYPVFTQPFPTS